MLIYFLIDGLVSVSANADGTYGLEFDDGTTRLATQAEIADAQAAYDAAQADAAAYQSQRTEVASNLQAMRDRLVLIRDAASPSNAQVIQAMRDMAQIQLRMLNYIRRL